MNLLIIEHDEEAFRLAVDTIDASNDALFFVRRQTSLADGVAYLQTGEVDVLLLDLQLPDSAGLAGFEQIRTLFPALPIVILSGVDDAAEAALAVAEGAQDYLVRHEITASLLSRTLRYAVERKRYQQSLQASEERYRALFEQANDAVFILDFNGRHLEVNQRAAEMLGYTPEEITRLTLWQVSGEIAESEGVLKRLIAGEHIPLYERRFVRRDGTRIPVEINAEVVRDAHGNPLFIQSIARDITARLQAEYALRASEEKYRSLVESSDAAITLISRGGVILFANTIAARIRQTTPGAIIGKAWTEVYPEHQYQAVETVFNTGRGIVFESMAVFQRMPRWYRISAQPVRNNAGETVAAIVNAMDITNQKHGEAALRESRDDLERRVNERTTELARIKENLEAIFNHSGDGIMLIDLDRGVQQTNQTFNALVGIEADGAFGAKLAAFFRPEDSDGIEKTVALVAAQHRNCRIETRVIRAEGLAVDVEISIAPVRSAEEPVTNVVCIVRDISERKASEMAFQALSQRLELATRSGGIGIWEWDVRSDILAWDEQMVALYGADSDQPSTGIERWLNTIHPEDCERAVAALYAALHGDSPFDAEFRVRRPDGTMRHLHGAAVVLRDPQGQPLRMIGVNIDITRLKEAEVNLLQALGKEKELSELKSRFVSMASHEFRTPLASILAAAESLTYYRSRMNEAQIADRLERIRQQVLHMKDIMEDVLQLARIQAGRVEYKPAPGDLDALCREIIDELDGLTPHHGRIDYACLAPSVDSRYDSRLMRQALSNLLTNALKYSPSEKKVLVRLEKLHEQFAFSVQDFGIGIPPEDLHRLFEPFHRARNVGEVSGTGLGLSIARQAVEKHGGTITVQSEIGAGSTFTILLPERPPEVEQDAQNTAD
ncbi:MAG: PAS domain S-box protein [Anaerolineae bacterium]|nr:PAS domain S-box protein [Anaerolineae bacterium]